MHWQTGFFGWDAVANHREYKQEVRDALYGFVYLSRAEWDIINSPAFQRLRDIKQLAMGYMVYPGAVHTRFEHSIGCVYQADRILHQVRENSRDLLESEFLITDANFERARELLRLAALLHDLGILRSRTVVRICCQEERTGNSFRTRI